MNANENVELRAGSPWVSLPETLLGAIRLNVIRHLLETVNRATGADQLVAWAGYTTPETEPEEYDPVGISVAEAQVVLDHRPYETLDELLSRGKLDHGRLADLVYAAAAEGAAEPRLVRVEDVFELSILGVATIASLSYPLPEIADDIEITVESARLDVLGQEVVVEWPVIVRQRQDSHLWAELELENRSRIWYVGLSADLYDEVVGEDSPSLVLYPRLGAEFSSTPLLELPIEPLSAARPLPTSPASNFYASFPEVEGALFLMEFVPSSGDGPVGFSAGESDVQFFGPSLPSEVVVHVGQESAVWRHTGQLTGTLTSPELRDSLQAALSAARASPSGGRGLLVTTTAKTPGQMTLALRADLYLSVDHFREGNTEQKLEFLSDTLERDISIQLPVLGQPVRADLELEGRLSRSVVVAEFAADPSPTGEDAIGVRLIPGVEYVQKLQVEHDFAMSTVSLRFAHASRNTSLTMEFVGPDGSVEASKVIPEGDRVPLWCAMELNEFMEVVAETTYYLRVSVTSGAVTWLCGRSHNLQDINRDDGKAPPSVVLDLTDQTPLAGRVRLHTELSGSTPQLSIRRVPDGEPLTPLDVVMQEDGRFSARIDLLSEVRSAGGDCLELRVSARAPGTVTATRPHIGYRLATEVR